MVKFTIWVVLVMVGVPVRPSNVELHGDDPIHHVYQDSSRGIQKIRIVVESEEVNRGNPLTSALPLSVETAAFSFNNDRMTYSKDSPNKRQVSTMRSIIKPKASAEAVKTTSRKEDAIVRNRPISVVAKNETNQLKEKKSNQYSEPKRNPYGIGNAVVLTVPTQGEQQWGSSVSQTQPEKWLPPPNKKEEKVSYDYEDYEDVGHHNVDPIREATNVMPQPFHKQTTKREPQPQPHGVERPHQLHNGESESSYGGFPESVLQNNLQSRPLQNERNRDFVLPQSPCSSVFSYKKSSSKGDSWEGELYISTEEAIEGIWIDIILDHRARLLANWFGEVSTRDNMKFTILNLRKRLEPGVPESIPFVIRFDPELGLPHVSSINLNGRIICPIRVQGLQHTPTTLKPIYENPFDLVTKPTRRPTAEDANTKRPVYVTKRPTPKPSENFDNFRINETRPLRQPERVPEQVYGDFTTKRPRPTVAPSPNRYEESQGNRLPQSSSSPRPIQSTSIQTYENVPCGKPSVQPRPLITHGQMTSRGQWPWHAAIYKNIGIDLTYICGGSLISKRHVVTAAHCVTVVSYDTRPVDPSVLVVYLGKYHLKLWSENGVTSKQVSEVNIHEDYNSTIFRADLAILVLSSYVEYTDFIRPVCLWDYRKTDISEVENKEGTVIGWGFDEANRLTEELMQAKMPVIEHSQCLWSYPDFFAHFTSNYTYCAGFNNGTSVCNGDSGGGMVFPVRSQGEERWFLRGLVSISVTEKEKKVCDTKHYVVFTDLAKYLDFLSRFI